MVVNIKSESGKKTAINSAVSYPPDMPHTILYMYDLPNTKEAVYWAIEYCKTYMYSNVFDISDLSLEHDTIFEIHFGSEQDAVWFMLRWS